MPETNQNICSRCGKPQGGVHDQIYYNSKDYAERFCTCGPEMSDTAKEVTELVAEADALVRDINATWGRLKGIIGRLKGTGEQKP